jgi:hypothetical protein
MARVRTNTQPRGLQRHDEERPWVVESDLPAEMAVGYQELQAIRRLLGDELDDILMDLGRN